MFALATYSQACLHEVANQLGLSYGSVAAYHVVFRTQEDFERSQSLRQQLKNAGLVHRVLSRDELFALEPSIRDASLPIEAALQVQGDEAGDCRAFVIKLWEQLIAGGAHWLGSTAVTSISANSSSLSECVLADGRRLSARYLILAAGPWSLTLLKELKPRLPIYPIRGFSLTAIRNCLSMLLVQLRIARQNRAGRRFHRQDECGRVELDLMLSQDFR
jgi:D-amino-acid dehydrogenase